MIVNTTKADGENMSSLRKAAMLLIVLGEQASADMLQHLTEDDAQKVSQRFCVITAISADQAETVLNEFHQISTAGSYVARGGVEYARKVLMRAFSPETAKRLLDRLAKALGNEAASFDAIQKADPGNSRSSSTTSIPRQSPWSSRISIQPRRPRCSHRCLKICVRTFPCEWPASIRSLRRSSSRSLV